MRDIGRLINEALELKARFKAHGRRDDIDAAVRLGEQVLALLPEEHELRAVALSNLAAALLTRFERYADPADVQAAVRRSRKAVDATPPDDESLGRRWTNLTLALRAGYLLSRQPADLQAAIEAGQAAVACNAPGLPSHGRALTNLATILHSAYELRHELHYLEEAVSLAQDAARTFATETDERAAADFNLGHLLRIRYEHTGDLSSLDEAIELISGAADRDPMVLANVSSAYRVRFERMGDPADLDAAVSAASQVAEAVPEDHPAAGMLLSELGVVLTRRFALSGARSDADEAVAAARRGVRLTPESHPRHGAHQSNLSLALLARYQRESDLADLNEAVDAARRAELAGGPPAWTAAVRTNLGGLLRSRYARLGDPPDLDAAVAVARRAIQDVPESWHDRCGLLTTLSTALRARFERLGDREDLEEAVTWGRAAVDTAPPEDPGLPRYRLNVAAALLSRFNRTGCPDDEQEALAQLRQALIEAPDDDPERARYLSHLSGALRKRALRVGDAADLDAAIEAARDSVSATPLPHLNRGDRLHNLAVALLTRFQHSSATADLDEAIEMGRQAVQSTPEGSAHRAGLQATLGSALMRRAILAGPSEGIGDAREAITLCEAAALDEAGTPMSRIEAARHWGRCAAYLGDWPQALTGLEHAIALLPLLAPRDLGRDDQEHRLAQLSGIAGDAAACAVQMDRPERALELIEAGRGVLFAQALDTKTDLADLDPSLSRRLERLRRDLDADDPRPAEQRRTLARQWAELVAEIRAVPEFARFGEPPHAAELIRQAQAGAIVVLNMSVLRCDALIVTPDGVRPLQLRELAMDEAAEQVERFRAALQGMPGRWRDAHDVLAWLWDSAVGPVLDTLHPEVERVWWIATGPLGALPVHAAGHHRDGSARTALDRVISSYTTTIRALASARAASAMDGGTLVVGDSQLTTVDEEIAMVRDTHPGTVVLRDASADVVLTELSTGRSVHFACHTRLDQKSPSRSTLQPRPEESIGLTEIARLRVHGAFLAYLSSCSTAEQHRLLPDEAIHLASAFQLAGYRHVVATLWQVRGLVALEVARAFYAAASDLDPAAALHQSVLAMRAEYTNLPALWAAHIHSGA
ncbi:CHAT domain-containing protein [Nonomuraea maritima]|uniref:CHAT domain-containing protein n=1 Tax=Nonomuraea maritima TaxID=683260 RepID=UPI0037104FF1